MIKELFKKGCLLVLIVFMVACSRNSSTVAPSGGEPDDEVTYTAYWTGLGATTGATNTVTNQLPSTLTSVTSVLTKSGFVAYAPPVIYSDSNNINHALVLWANNTNLQLKKYTINDDSVTEDPDFTSITLSSDSAGFKAHQLVLNIENGTPYVYVAYNSGIKKINANDGTVVAEYTDSSNAMFSVQVIGNFVYFTSGTRAYQTDLGLQNSKAVSVSSATALTRPLPIVESGDYIYLAHPTAITKIDANTFTVSATFTIDPANPIQNLAAYTHNGTAGVIIAQQDTNTVESMNDHDSLNDNRYFSTLIYAFFDGSLNTDVFKAYASCRQDSNNSSIGDASHAVLAVNGTTSYLANSYNTFKTVKDSDSNNVNPGVVSYTLSSYTDCQKDDSTSFFTGDATPELLPESLTTATTFPFYYADRFFVLDTNGTGVTVQNTNESFFRTDINNNSTKITEDGDYGSLDWNILTKNAYDPSNTPNEDLADILDTYNTRIVVGNTSKQSIISFSDKDDKDVAIESIAIGNQIILLAGNNGQLYLAK